MKVIHINGVPVSLAADTFGFVATVGVFGLVTVRGATELDALRAVAELLDLRLACIAA